MNGKRQKKNFISQRLSHIIKIPKFKFFTIEGKGNPNEEAFGDYVGVLYSLAYAVKMSCCFKMMIRQPDFVDNDYADFIIGEVKKNRTE